LKIETSYQTIRGTPSLKPKSEHLAKILKIMSVSTTFTLKLLIILATLHESIELSCDFIDTINITAGSLDQNHNYLHNGIVYTRDLYATFDFIFDHHNGKLSAPPHIRGCICNLKPCIRVCCHDRIDTNSSCVKTSELIVPTSTRFEKIDLRSENFAVIEGWPCKTMYTLEPAEFEYDKWIFEVNNR
jgi:G protein-coupled receptor Mth (Methuselah protein)